MYYLINMFSMLVCRDWKKNLYTKEASYPKKVRQLERLPENIFNDWLHNFNVHYTQVKNHYKANISYQTVLKYAQDDSNNR